MKKTLEDYLKTITRGQPVKYIVQDEDLPRWNLPSKEKVYHQRFYHRKEKRRTFDRRFYLFPRKGVGTTSNFYGFYSVTLDEDSIDFHVTYSGFVPFSARINLVQDLSINISLDASVVVNEVVVVNSENKRNSITRAVGKTDVSSTFIKSLPSLLGEADVFKSLQMLPGVQAGNEGSSGLNVRGGSPIKT